MFFYLDFDGVVLVGPVELGLAHDGHLEAAGAGGRRRVRVLLNSAIAFSKLLFNLSSPLLTGLLSQRRNTALASPGVRARRRAADSSGVGARRRLNTHKNKTFLNTFLVLLVKYFSYLSLCRTLMTGSILLCVPCKEVAIFA